MSCDCNSPGGSSNPPGTTFPSTSAPAGTRSPFGGRTIIPRGPCGPPPCPSPPVSTQQSRSPYVPDWLATLTTNWFGQLLIVADGALQLLKSKCSGWLRYDAGTQNVVVDGQPPFMSDTPMETDFGYVALVVPTTKLLCEDDNVNCPQEVRAQVKAQVLGEAGCGDIVLVSAPLCGQIPADQAADANNQVRFDRASLPELDDEPTKCAEEIRFLVGMPSTRQVGNQTVNCTKWLKARRLRMSASQWGDLGGANLAQAFLPALKRVGGTDADPCMEMAQSDINMQRISDLLTGRMTFIPSLNVLWTARVGDGSFATSLPNYPDATVVWGIFISSISNIISGETSLLLNGQTLNFCRDTTGSAQQLYMYSLAPLPASTQTFVVSSVSTTPTTSLELLGYLATSTPAP